MKNISLSNLLAGLLALTFSLPLVAQQGDLQYFRPWNKNGINVFEPSKTAEQPEFKGMSVRIGGSFTQDYQNLTHSNKAVYAPSSATNKLNKNYLYGYIKAEDTTSARLAGFNLAMANLNLDFQVDDGIRVCLENYMSARHHNEFWVKGGYIQIDKLPMFGNPQWFTDYVRVKIGHFQPNFGDQQFRRSDGGNALFNPFAENFIIDAFTTEIGGEVYLFPAKNIMLMGGMSSGFINGNIIKTPDAINSSGVVQTKRSPSIFAKVAYDNNVNDDLRVRLSASVYHNPNSQRNTLFAGDRTGSHYFGIMEPATIGGLPISIGTSPSNTATQAGPNFTSGRFDPGVSNRVTAVVVNPFIKYKGAELFGSLDFIKGSVYADVSDGEWMKRNWTQVAVEGLYRFLPNEQAYIGVRYNTVTGEARGLGDVTIERKAVSAGWFPTQNLLLKLEYVNQDYKNFPTTDYRYGGNFKGMMVEAVIGL